MNIAIIQARLGSTRFPAKIMQSVWGHMNALEFMVERVRLAKSIDRIYIATTDNPADKEIVDLCNSKGWYYYIGDENDVMRRVCGLIEDHSFQSDTIIDLTSDCTFVSPEMIDKMLNTFHKLDYDFYSNTMVRSFFDGADIQIFRGNMLIKTDYRVQNKQHRTHVGWNIIAYNSSGLVMGNLLSDDFMPDTRIVLDTPEDLIVIKNIISHFNRLDFTHKELIELIKANPKILNDNKKIISKTPGVD